MSAGVDLRGLHIDTGTADDLDNQDRDEDESQRRVDVVWKRANQVRSWPSLLAGAVSAAMSDTARTIPRTLLLVAKHASGNDPRQIPRLQIARTKHEDQKREQYYLHNGPVASSKKNQQSQGCKSQEGN